MNDESVPVLWEAIQRTDGDIPWSALEAFAEALVARPDLIDDLFNAYDEARQSVQDRACYVHLYVPAILALAAPGLDERCRQEIGERLIARLVAAGEQDDHLMMEILVAACGAMGPVVLPMVFGVVIDEAASSAAWDQLWGLTKLAIGADATLREQVVAACIALLERVARDEVEYELGVEAARMLASLGHIEHIGLLRRLERQSRWTLAHGDYADACRALEEPRAGSFPQELWELPVRDWLAPRWQRTRDWLVMRDSGWRNWETLQTTCVAEPFTAPIRIVTCSPKSGCTESRYAAVRP